MFFQNKKSFELDYLVQRLAAQQFFGVTGSWFHPFVGRIGEDDAEFFGWREAAQEIEFVLARFFSMAEIDCRSSSTKSTDAAPRLSASMPSAPLPAKRSRICAPMMTSPKLEKIAAFTRSIVGRTPALGPASRTPPARPAITLMANQLAWRRFRFPPLLARPRAIFSSSAARSSRPKSC